MWCETEDSDIWDKNGARETESKKGKLKNYLVHKHRVAVPIEKRHMFLCREAAD